jgi:hypothetical protein
MALSKPARGVLLPKATRRQRRQLTARRPTRGWPDAKKRWNPPPPPAYASPQPGASLRIRQHPSRERAEPAPARRRRLRGAIRSRRSPVHLPAAQPQELLVQIDTDGADGGA